MGGFFSFVEIGLGGLYILGFFFGNKKPRIYSFTVLCQIYNGFKFLNTLIHVL